MGSNPLAAIPATIRRWLYIVYGVATLVVSSTAAWCGATQQAVPNWAIGLGGALVPLGAAFAGVAASNITPPPNTAVVTAPAEVSIGTELGDPEWGAVAVGILIAFLALVLACVALIGLMVGLLAVKLCLTLLALALVLMTIGALVKDRI